MAEYKPYQYQERAEKWITDHKRCALFLDMGLGKSVITLTAARFLLDICDIERVLVVAPKKVAESTWQAEGKKWEHLKGLRFSLIMGTPAQRTAALHADAEIYVMSRDNVVWLLEQTKGQPPFDMLVLDELTSFKNPGAKRFKALRKMLPFFRRVVGLTGTPAPNGLLDLWAQIYCLDQGERLGRYITRYRAEFFNCHRWNNVIIKTSPKKGAEEAIRKKIQDICLTMQAKDYLTLPPCMVHDVVVQMDEKTRKQYKAFERESVAEVADKGENVTILAANAAALMNKLSQWANGAIYDEQGQARHIHDFKATRLAEMVEEAKSPCLVFYQYKHDIPPIIEQLKGYRVAVYKDAEDLQRWNAGELDVLLAHPASTAFGLNMQQGGHVAIWYGMTWNLELYQQANARLHRQGQTHTVMIYHLLTAGTVDERISEALRKKSKAQDTLIQGLKALKKEYKFT